MLPCGYKHAYIINRRIERKTSYQNRIILRKEYVISKQVSTPFVFAGIEETVSVVN